MPVLKEVVKAYLGSSEPKTASPVYQVKQGEPTAFLLLAGEADEVVVARQMAVFKAELQKQGARVEAWQIKGRGHRDIFAGIPQDDEVAEKLVAFLESIGGELTNQVTVVAGKQAIYITTSNRDGRGEVKAGDDKVLRWQGPGD
ncbi:hypothetical protein A2W24_05175 [Microgenomates group bacterium RBG_16_45_19]|nr:MAG: hypothetical protein A2W24_05175 [Microgenomates group bacterium RBG_16_45_19]